MSDVFSQANPNGKKTILLFLAEAKINMFFYFDEQVAHSFFFKEYPQFYRSVQEGSFLLDASGKLHLFGSVNNVSNGQVSVTKMNWRSGDGNHPDWAEKFTCPAFSNGIEVTFSINLLDNIQIKTF